MDLDLALYLIPLLGAVALGLPPLFVLRKTHLRFTKKLASLPKWGRVFTLDDLSPTELARLCGGERRAAETALMGLYLDGHVRPSGRGPYVELVRNRGNGSDPDDPLRGVLMNTLQRTGRVPIAALLHAGRTGRGMKQIHASLGGKALMINPLVLREALRHRGIARALVWSSLLTGLLATGAGALSGEGIGDLANGLLLAGPVLVLLASLAMLTASLTGGWRLHDMLSPSGTGLAKAGRVEYGGPMTGTATRDEALRHTAVNGMRRLVRVGKPTLKRRRDRDGEEVTLELVGVEPTDSSSGAGAGPASDAGDGGGERGFSIDLEVLYGFAEECAKVSDVGGSSTAGTAGAGGDGGDSGGGADGGGDGGGGGGGGD